MTVDRYMFCLETPTSDKEKDDFIISYARDVVHIATPMISGVGYKHEMTHKTHKLSLLENSHSFMS